MKFEGYIQDCFVVYENEYNLRTKNTLRRLMMVCVSVAKCYHRTFLPSGL